MSNSPEKELEKATKNLRKQEECFGRVLDDRRNMSEEDFDSYCEEMQYALDKYDEAIKKTM